MKNLLKTLALTATLALSGAAFAGHGHHKHQHINENIKLYGDGQGTPFSVVGQEIDTTGLRNPVIVVDINTKRSFGEVDPNDTTSHGDQASVSMTSIDDGFQKVIYSKAIKGNFKGKLVFTDVPVGVVQLTYHIQTNYNSDGFYKVKRLHIKEGNTFLDIPSESSLSVTGDGNNGKATVTVPVNLTEQGFENPKMIVKLDTNGTFNPDDRIVIKLRLPSGASFGKHYRLGDFNGEFILPKLPEGDFNLEIGARTYNGNAGTVTIESIEVKERRSNGHGCHR